MTPSLEHIVTVRPGESESATLSYAELIEKGNPEQFEAAEVDPSHVKLLMYTSGTTGIPKGVLHSHNTLRRSAANSREARGVGEGDITLMASPVRSEEHTSELQSLMRISYAVFCLKKKRITHEPQEQNLYTAQINTKPRTS